MTYRFIFKKITPSDIGAYIYNLLPLSSLAKESFQENALNY